MVSNGTLLHDFPMPLIVILTVFNSFKEDVHTMHMIKSHCQFSSLQFFHNYPLKVGVRVVRVCIK